MNNSTTENTIELRTITKLLGMNFFIPEYQRGYRWTPYNVKQLLDDIWEYRTKGEPNTFYCLQPVVVKAATWKDRNDETISGYELIDGQQRLTTLHRILTYLMREFLKVDSLQEDYNADLYNIYYKTRLISKDFLQSNLFDNSKPDLYYMSEAYKTIKEWFEDETRGFLRADKNMFLDTILPSSKNAEWSLEVIWYEVNETIGHDSKALFTRLNRGKIPLTSAELIKAKFLNSDSFKSKSIEEQTRRKTEIVQIWDEIEARLNEPRFWAFVTNRKQSEYSTKIELIFDILTNKKEVETDPLYSFIHFFSVEESSESLWEKWIKVEDVYHTLSYWFSDKDFYHHIGYLISIGTSVSDLIKLKRENRKSNFQEIISSLISDTIPADWTELRFDQSRDRDKLNQLLLLHNLEIIRRSNHSNEFFPFEAYKAKQTSLEHIHAQNIEGIDPNKKDQWLDWLREHVNVLKEKKDPEIDALVKETEEAYEIMTFQLFKTLSNKILSHFSKEEDKDSEFMHRIENLALLGLSENTSLSNSVFEVKRRKLMKMDKKGDFIPVATRRIFMKYFSDDSEPNYSLWSMTDRENYIKDLQLHFSLYIKESNMAIDKHEN